MKQLPPCRRGYASACGREGDARHDRYHVAKHRNLSDEAVARGMAEMNIQLAATGRRIAPTG
jgi:hypothetical protein